MNNLSNLETIFEAFRKSVKRSFVFFPACFYGLKD